MLLQHNQTYGGCGGTFDINPDDVRGDKFVQCPHCDGFTENPFYDESFKESKETYIG